jgi:hypothetical protein
MGDNDDIVLAFGTTTLSKRSASACKNTGYMPLLPHEAQVLCYLGASVQAGNTWYRLSGSWSGHSLRIKSIMDSYMSL